MEPSTIIIKHHREERLKNNNKDMGSNGFEQVDFFEKRPEIGGSLSI